jgi:hypothetical protein
MWKQHVLPALGQEAPFVDALRHALMTPSRLTQSGPSLQTIERLMQLCRRLFRVPGSEAMLTNLLDVIALALCELAIRTPYLVAADTRALAQMPEIIESFDVLLERGEPWPKGMLEASLVILAHTEADGPAASRQIVRLLPRLGLQAARTLVLPATLASGLHTLLLHPLRMELTAASLVAGRLARRLCSTGHGDLVVGAMDLSQGGKDTAPPVASSAELQARTAMTRAIIEAMGSIKTTAQTRSSTPAFANVISLSRWSPV